MSEVEIFEFPYGAFLKQRLEFVLLRDDDLQARIMRVIEYRMIRMKSNWLEKVAQAIEENKPEPPAPDYWTTLTYAQITVQLYMFNSSRSGEGRDLVEGKKNSLSRNTLGKAMRALIEDKYILTRPNPDKTKEYDATQYKLNIPLIQEHLSKLPKDAKQPILYLANNGRINGDPCTKFLHPPCTEILQGDAQNLDMGRKEILQGDVKISDHLIEEGIEVEKNSNRESITDHSQNSNTSPNGAIHTLIEEMMKRLEVVEQENQSLRSDNQLLLEKLSTQEQQLPTSNTQDKPTSTGADEQASYSHPATENLPPTLPNGKENNKRTKKDATQDLTLQGSHVIEVYEAFKKRKITRNTGNVKAANGLGEVVETDQDLNEVLTLMANDKFLKEHGVRIDLDFVYRKYDGFLDRVDKLREQAKKRTSGNNNYPDMSNASIEETDPYVLATMRSAGRLLAAVN